MDPFSAEGELLNLHNYFHQGQFAEAASFDTSGLSAENALPARVLSLRAQLALKQYDDVLADVAGESEVELKAVGALATFLNGEEAKGVQAAEKLAKDETAKENAVVQICAGTVLQAGGKSEEALELLALHQGNCELHFQGGRLGRNSLGRLLLMGLQWRQLHWLYKFTWSRTDWTWRSRRLQMHGNGHRIVYWSTLQKAGLD